ncbi:MAG: 50S ribosomal protein L24 [Candidatus Latescibacteria bacterium]|jgi:large subunit ribosomal protein L24|nr:50S ribosomal protein L24 [bacterium]MBD3425235.1 50S ribosomal protein L24 [Candidatus Latescibacterota bacterium]
MRIKKNDVVRVIAGNYKGAEGRVLKVFPSEDRVVVEKVNLIKRHTRPRSQEDQGGIIEKEAPVSASNVMLVCPKCGEPVKTSRVKLADGHSARKCKNCSETIDDEG